jgi:hypothetical protein
MLQFLLMPIERLCISITNLDSYIMETQPKLWIHGHTHESMDYFIDKTRIVCNPFGYWQYDENRRFQENLIIEVKDGRLHP